MCVCRRVALVFGIFILICGIVFGVSWPFVNYWLSVRSLNLSPSSESYKLWEKTPIPLYLDVYLFNWTNSQEFLNNKNLKPEFEEIGPFVFKEVHQKVGVIWNENGTVSYNQTRTWTFVPEESVDLSTPIYNLNVVAATVTQMASAYGFLIRELVNILETSYSEKILINRPAREWLFDGISDKLLNFIKKYETFLKTDIPFDKFGWFYGRNLSSTFDGRFTINTGRDDIYNLGDMEEWNYVNKTKFYKGECGVVRGTSGELFAPMKNNQDKLTIFVTDFCGPLTLNLSGTAVVKGLEGLHYIGDESVFDNGELNPNSRCFCTGECIPSGVRNVTSCRLAPLFISFPHFYLADPIYRESVVGMAPNKSEHEFYLSIDSMLGVPLEVRAQLQINVLLKPLPGFKMFANVPKIYVPMMWFRQRAVITPELASRVKAVLLGYTVGPWVTGALCVLGAVIIIVTSAAAKLKTRRKSFEPLVMPEEEESDGNDGSDTNT